MKKSYAASNSNCRVTFRLPEQVDAQAVTIVGDFNNWDVNSHPMRRLKNGSFSKTLSLKPGDYRFRYLLDGVRWENDWAADSYVANGYGGEDSLVRI